MYEGINAVVWFMRNMAWYISVTYSYLILYNLVPQVLTEKHISSNIISKDKNNSCITKDRKV